MTYLRKALLVLVVAPLTLVLLIVLAALLPPVQTAVANRVLAEHGGKVDRLAVGFSGVKFDGLVYEQPGLSVRIPSFVVELPLVEAAQGRIELRGLAARDISVGFDPVVFAAAQAKKPAPEKTAATAKPFEGVLRMVELPAGLSVNRVDVSGAVRVSGPNAVTARFSLKADGVVADATGSVNVTLDADAGPQGKVVAALDFSPGLDAAGQLSALALVLRATAEGGLLPAPAKIKADFAVAREGAGESYKVSVANADTPLLELDTGWRPGVTDLPGRWKVALASGDVRPFLPPGMALPEFVVGGAGSIKVAAADRLRADGELKVEAWGLENAGLPALGRVGVKTAFDFERAGEALRVNRVVLDLAAADTPVLSVASLQPFGIVLETLTFKPEAADRPLIEARLLRVPPEWVSPFVPELALGGPVTAAFVVHAAEEGFAVESIEPFRLSAIAYGPADARLVAFEQVSLDGIKASHTRAGITAEVGAFSVVGSGSSSLVGGKVFARLPTGGPTEVAAELTADLGALARQPVLAGQTRLSAGQAALKLDATLGETLAASGRLDVTHLKAGVADSPSLPRIGLDFDASLAPNGKMVARLPLVVSNPGAQRESDLVIDAVFKPGSPNNDLRAKLVGKVLHVVDLQAFSALAPEAPAAPAPQTKPVPPGGPLWAGFTGEIELDLARVVQVPGLEASVRGKIVLTPDAAALEQLRVLLGTGGTLDLGGKLTWRAPQKDYALAAEVAGKDIAVGALFRAFKLGAQPPIDGTYALTAKLVGVGADPAAAAKAVAAEVALIGRGGVLRAINIESNRFARAGGAVAGLAGLAGALTGNAEVSRRAAQLAAANEIARAFSNLNYDEISLVARRGRDGSVEIGELKLATPELLLSGSGGLRAAAAGQNFWTQPLSLRLNLSASGTIADHLATLNLLAPPAPGARPEDKRDLIEPVMLDGTLAQVGTQQLTRLLMRAAGL